MLLVIFAIRIYFQQLQGGEIFGAKLRTLIIEVFKLAIKIARVSIFWCWKKL